MFWMSVGDVMWTLVSSVKVRCFVSQTNYSDLLIIAFSHWDNSYYLHNVHSKSLVNHSVFDQMFFWYWTVLRIQIVLLTIASFLFWLELLLHIYRNNSAFWNYSKIISMVFLIFKRHSSGIHLFIKPFFIYFLKDLYEKMTTTPVSFTFF